MIALIFPGARPCDSSVYDVYMLLEAISCCLKFLRMSKHATFDNAPPYHEAAVLLALVRL